MRRSSRSDTEPLVQSEPSLDAAVAEAVQRLCTELVVCDVPAERHRAYTNIARQLLQGLAGYLSEAGYGQPECGEFGENDIASVVAAAIAGIENRSSTFPPAPEAVATKWLS